RRRGDRDCQGREAQGKAGPVCRAAQTSRAGKCTRSDIRRGRFRRAAAAGNSGLFRRNPMKLLLDTHVFIWWNQQNPSLASALRDAVADAQNEVYVSAASVWEIAIKRTINKIRFERDIAGAIAANGFKALPITAEHAERASALPRHHGDPFDRMLIA